MQASQCSTDSQTSEASFGDRSVNNPFGSEPVEQASRDLVTINPTITVSSLPLIAALIMHIETGWNDVRSVVLCNLLAQNENLVVALQLLSQRLVQGISDSDFF